MVVVDTIAAYIGGSAAQANWLGPEVGGHLALSYIHQMNRVNSRNGCDMMTAPQTLSYLLLNDFLLTNVIYR